MKTAKNRNEQFENIARIKSEYETSGNPIISNDTKKKRTLATIIGMHLYTQEVIHTYDHDFNSFADGTIVLHSIYDIRLNTGYINIGTSKDTSEFACDSLRNWWYNKGQYDYPHASGSPH